MKTDNLSRRTLLSLLAGLPLAVSLPAQAEDPYMLGVEYKKVPKPQAKEKTVTEFFFYGCTHCWHLEPSIKAWLKLKPKDVTFERIPAVFDNPSWIFFARAFYTAQNLGILEQSHLALFEALHQDRLQLFTIKKLAAWYSQFGVAPKEFEQMFKSFKVDAQVQEAARLTRNMGIDGVPAIVVNGTWLTDVAMATSRDNLWQVVNWLLKK
ncbi:MAG TPA: thiol:disulfide interchange protein DsbA/DsbL [Piscirickettsiaceae bacterium]|nr:thiol:disulfide interchange protein DsbA/DsbL [Piscirickettsiaceae bacterium]